MVDDALSMNMGDIAAAGFVTGPISVTDIINVNRFGAPKDVIMEQVGRRMAQLKELYGRYGLDLSFLGGETADLPDQVGTNVFDMTVHAIAREEDLILGNVEPNDKIWGFASGGRAIWETEPSSDLMSNGFTLARTVLTKNKYPDLSRSGFRGRYAFGDQAGVGESEIDVHAALILPTRQWAILIKILIDKLKERNIFSLLHGISMNTGGGATKIRNLGAGRKIHYWKHGMPPPSPIFRLIQMESGESWKNMYEAFNCRVGIDIVGDEQIESALKEVSQETGVELYSLGKCLRGSSSGNTVDLETSFGDFSYF